MTEINNLTRVKNIKNIEKMIMKIDIKELP